VLNTPPQHADSVRKVIAAGKDVYCEWPPTLDTVTAIQPLGLQFKPGETAPLHCTSTGKIYMSRLPLRQREKLVNAISMHHIRFRTQLFEWANDEWIALAARALRSVALSERRLSKAGFKG
jgi:hypothetical protein